MQTNGDTNARLRIFHESNTGHRAYRRRAKGRYTRRRKYMIMQAGRAREDMAQGEEEEGLVREKELG